MQFNSYIFILLFLPVFIIGYFLSNKIHFQIGKIFIIAAGIAFYMYAGLGASVIFGVSILFNYIASFFISMIKKHKKVLLILSVTINIGLLFYYKYYNFFISSINKSLIKEFAVKDLILPLGISFFTFQQIMYLVSVYKKEIERTVLIDYLSYILYFPKLIMGPLVEPKFFIDQLNDRNNKKIQWNNIAYGLRIFSYGLFKKMILADTFSRAVAWGYSNIADTTSADLFLIMLFYTFEIYFDFSGYTDMAIGISTMINISLPMNFDSPYKALSIRDFWKRWHMSLTGFLTKYIYFPLGGSKKGTVRTYVNIMIVFLVSGLWHGANWTFILWGFIHGILQIIERIFNKTCNKVFIVVRWAFTFFAVNILWLLFRSESITQWGGMLTKMFSFQNMAISNGLIDSFTLPETSFIFDQLHLAGLNSTVRGFGMIIFILFAFLVCLLPENNYRTMNKTTIFNAVISAVAFCWAFLCLSSESVFVYFNF